MAFHPWIGTNYDASLPKILVLGESHYGVVINDQLTKHVVNDWGIGNEGSRRFFTLIAKIISGKPDANLSKAEKSEFWHKVAFYNYVQEFVAEGPRVRPTPKMWEDAKEPFKAVLKQYTPDIVIVLGINLGGHIKAYESEITGTSFCYLRHPSGRGFNKKEAFNEFTKSISKF
jgi:hypothetical protein